MKLFKRQNNVLPALALLAYEERLSFEIDHSAEGVSILLFKRGTRPEESLSADGGAGI